MLQREFIAALKSTIVFIMEAGGAMCVLRQEVNYNEPYLHCAMGSYNIKQLRMFYCLMINSLTTSVINECTH